MSLFQRKPDPLSKKAEELNAEIARIEREIRRLSEPLPKRRATLKQPPAQRTARSGTETAPSSTHPSTPMKPSAPPPQEPSSTISQAPMIDDHFNAQGLRKFDLLGVWQRLLQPFRGPAPTRSEMANLLVAGSVHGLRPLRYEKRIARNRFIALFTLLVLILLGLARVYFHKP